MKANLRKRALLFALALLLGLGSLGAGRMMYRGAGGDVRDNYRELETDVYFPTFFIRYAQERDHHAEWLKNATVVALTYVGRTRVCPTQQISGVSATGDRIVFLITRSCPYSVALVKQFRIEMVRRDGNWEIEWAGMRLKCAVNQSRLGAYLIGHNPFRAWREPWDSAWRNFAVPLANSLNPWMTQCP
jgi:hypothetical protein